MDTIHYRDEENRMVEYNPNQMVVYSPPSVVVGKTKASKKGVKALA